MRRPGKSGSERPSPWIEQSTYSVSRRKVQLRAVRYHHSNEQTIDGKTGCDGIGAGRQKSTYKHVESHPEISRVFTFAAKKSPLKARKSQCWSSESTVKSKNENPTSSSPPPFSPTMKTPTPAASRTGAAGSQWASSTYLPHGLHHRHQYFQKTNRSRHHRRPRR